MRAMTRRPGVRLCATRTGEGCGLWLCGSRRAGTEKILFHFQSLRLDVLARWPRVFLRLHLHYPRPSFVDALQSDH